jgi:GAF domain-containing protein
VICSGTGLPLHDLKSRGLMETQKAVSRNDSERVAALQKYAILDTEPEQAFDDLTLLASCDIAFCSVAIQQPDVMVVPDTLKDERFRDNPFVTSEPNIRFYAGAPLINEDGYALGTLCVIDKTPRDISGEQKEALQALSRLVLAQLELRRNLKLLKEALTERTKDEHEREREIVKLQQQLTRVLGLNIQ